MKNYWMQRKAAREWPDPTLEERQDVVKRMHEIWNDQEVVYQFYAHDYREEERKAYWDGVRVIRRHYACGRPEAFCIEIGVSEWELNNSRIPKQEHINQHFEYQLRKFLRERG